MKLIKPYYEIITSLDGDNILKSIERAARTCYKSENNITSDISSAEKLIKKLLSMGHEAMLEFGPSITVKFICDRGVSHELVRHRLASFAQESTRYCNYSKDKFDNQITFIIPPWIELNLIQRSVISISDIKNYFNMTIDHESGIRSWISTLFDIEKKYNILIKMNWTPQQARSILPNSLKTEINIKANIREWRHIFKLRTNKAAHPQMQELMIPLLKDFKRTIPVLFDDINLNES